MQSNLEQFLAGNRTGLIVGLVYDNSASIYERGLVPNILAADQTLLTRLQAGQGIRCKRMLFNEDIDDEAVPFQRLEDVQPLTEESLNAHGGTPLFPRSREALICVRDEAWRIIEEEGIILPTVTIIVADGINNDRRAQAADVAALSTAMIATGLHTIFGIGLGKERYFRQAFAEMGIPAHCIETVPEDTASVVDTCVKLGTLAALASTSPQYYHTVFMQGNKP